MKTATIAGMVLAFIGMVSLGYEGIRYTTQKKVLQVGSLEATKTEHHEIPLPPLLGGICLAGGVALMAVGARSEMTAS